MASLVVFSGNTIGNQVLVEVVPPPVVTVSYLSYYTMLFLPLVACLLVNTWLLKRYKQFSM